MKVVVYKNNRKFYGMDYLKQQTFCGLTEGPARLYVGGMA